ncbi:MAG: formyltetrahydrofolate deformylase [Caulobacteraceae bacterium]
MTPRYVLTLSCPDQIGIVADVSRFLVQMGCNITESGQYNDQGNGRFFLRNTFESTKGVSLNLLREAFAPLADTYQMDAKMFDAAVKTPTVIMVSKFGHCLNDLLFRWRIGSLPIDIKAVISNHRDFQDLVEDADLPFHYLPVTAETKPAQEAALEEILDRTDAELIVLARYMQVLSHDICARHPGQIINIHHSFLPSFKGARPYHQAYERGVKLIGATAHYVTDDLDEGPIIEQEVQRAPHYLSPDDYVALGRDTEALVLSRAVRWQAEHRVLLNGKRTVVFQ